MIRDTLDNLPVFELPENVHLAWYQAGDEQHWLAIHIAADQFNTFSLKLYQREFGTDAALLAQRQCFLVDQAGRYLGTTTAWVDDRFGAEYGRIHWVAIVPEAQGSGLAKPLLRSACLRLRELGHTRAYLLTSTARIPALNLYLRFGFKPHISGETDRERWELVRDLLKYPLE